MKVLIPNFWKRSGLVPVIVQDIATKEVLMLAFTDEAGYLETLRTGFAVYFSRSRWRRWKKGEESGNVQLVRNILIGCDGSAIVYQVQQKGDGACHTRAKSCFYRDFLGNQIMQVPESGWKENLLSAEAEVASSFSAAKTAKVFLPTFSKNFGLVDTVVQDFSTGRIVMAASVNRAGYFEAISTGSAIYSYSPQHERWYRENPASNAQTIRQILVDCDGDALVYKVESNTSHNSSQSSSYRNFVGKQIAEMPLCAEKLFTAEIDVVGWLAASTG